MKNIIIIEAEREGYSPTQIRTTMTAGELILVLRNYDEDAPVYFSHDNGYTYGGLKEGNIDERTINEDDE